jgi:methylmalonyl-CoA mutase N-terminal domain/subunit
MNGYESAGEGPKIETLKIDMSIEKAQSTAVQQVRSNRDTAKAAEALVAIGTAASEGTNMMPPIIDAVRASCTVGEISDVFRDKFGVYGDPAWI